MIIEFIGPTGSGKSTISEEVLEKLQELGINAISSFDFIMKKHRLGWIKNPILRSIVIDILAFPYFIRSFKKYYALLIFVSRIIFRDADSKLYALNLLRNIIKRIGLYEFIRINELNNSVYITDEGVVHQLHGIFVHIKASPRKDEIIRFINLIPFPDIIIYVYSSPEMLIERTYYRGHKRIKELSISNIKTFITNACYAFEILTSTEKVQKKLFSVENFGVGPEAIFSSSKKIVDYIITRYRDAGGN